MTLRTRASKGSALTHNELDANFKKVVTQKTSAYTVTVADNRATIEGNHASTPFTITLPTVANAGAAETGDFEVTITNINAAVVTVDGNGAETIDGAANLALQQWDSVTCQLDSAGNAWKTVNRVHADLSFDASGDATFANALTVSGDFNSRGIDDNATGEVLELSDTNMDIGTNTSASTYSIRRAVDDGSMTITAGSGAVSGASIEFYGGTHATLASDMFLQADNVTWLGWDESDGELTISTGSGSKTDALTINSSQAATFAGDVTVSGAFTSVGIDDNATTESLQVSDGSIQVGGTSQIEYDIHRRGITNGSLIFAGGDSIADGGGMLLYGSTHSSRPGDVILRSGGETFFWFDESAGDIELLTGVGTKTSALTIDASQNATFASSVYVSGGAAVGWTSLDDVVVGDGAGSAGVVINAGATNTGRYAFGDSVLAASLEYDFNADELILNTGGASHVPALTIDASQNATFAGTVDVSGQNVTITNATTPAFIATDTTNTVTTHFRSADTVGQAGTITAHNFALLSNNTTALTLDTSQNATFANDVTVTGDISAANLSLPAAQVTNHIRAGYTQIWNGDTATGSNYDVDSNVTEATWESIGPTGSGADNIWSIMDDLPSSATVLLATLIIQVTPNSASQSSCSVYVTYGDDATPSTGTNNRVGLVAVDPNAASSAHQFSSEIHIPLGPTNQDFQIHWDAVASSNTAVLLVYRGFITD